MAYYRLRYTVNVDLMPAGTGQLPAQTAALPYAAGSDQSLGLVNALGIAPILGSGASGVIASADITTLTNAMAADIAAQMNLTANLTKMQGWATGSP